MPDQLSISLNILIPSEILTQIKEIQAELTGVFNEQRKYDPTGHISVLNKFMEEAEFSTFVEILKEYFQKITPFEIALDYFGKTKSNKYVFLYFDDEYNRKLR